MPAHQKTCLALGFGLAVLVAGAVQAQEAFPSKPIEVVTHAGVGGGTDITARMMMVQAPAALKTELVVANKTGGSGSASLGYALSRPKDGHTIMLITQTHLLTLLQGKGAGVKVGDLIGIARATEDPQVLMVGASSPYKTAQDFIAAAKTKSLKFGTTQIGSVDHIAVVGFAEKAGLMKPIAVPFRGGGDIVVNLVGGNLDGALLNYAEAESQIKANEVRALIVFSRSRMGSLPQTPTATEIGIPAVYSTTRGFAVLKGTPEDRIKALEEGLIKSMQGKIYQDYLKSSGQSEGSVVGRTEWQAEIDEFLRTGDVALTSLGIKK
ncbi:tripartite tricarboxylate transporter substrate binding protein [Bosea sp. (in: a-proteobacteria)]|jgi:tripartite-type tricarboxylate transporter receptor subunit TctC|uniref:Bug family tripartite tricarboxylate transporter substrate binding protein n=1 Tax=Bosea sp. (in: a-proteobacteria) TaxID=1871050 RepID=UPI0025C3A7F5|nr:tripartite tricarboxylate transporter substrate binding protein [Bosea sp. (in: a-proteobacteria)]MBR3189385.1 tripartite tricarboxylate transporter substrate binding protein [Bosea sp. (in: a-proteobacteria)]